MKIRIFFFSITVSSLLTTSIYAQKKFTIEISFPSDLNGKDIGVEYDNGIKVITVSPIIGNNKINLSDSFYSKYLALTLTYPDQSNVLFTNRFFISDKHAQIDFLPKENNISIKNPLLRYKSVNVIEIDKTKEAKKLETYAKQEIKGVESFLSKYSDKLNNDDTLMMEFSVLAKKLDDKKIDFIVHNGDLYYSFWLFRTEIAPLYYLSADSLLSIYNKAFPELIKLSREGQELKKFLQGRAYTINNNCAPAFNVKDIAGNNVSLNEFKGKYVIINFWASWCMPCIQHIPQLIELQNKIGANKLQIISISQDKNFAKFEKAIKDYQMNWIHIFGNDDLIRAYGNKPLPGLYLINPEGKIICNNYENGDEQFFSSLKNL